MVPISATNLDRPRHVRFPTVSDRTADIVEVRFVPRTDDDGPICAGLAQRIRSSTRAAFRECRPRVRLGASRTPTHRQIGTIIF
jgi:hypothetical protein